MPRFFLRSGFTLIVSITFIFILGTVYGKDSSPNRQKQEKAKQAAPIGKMRGMPAPTEAPDPSAHQSPTPSVGKKIEGKLREKQGVIASDPTGAPRPDLSQ